MAHLHTHTHTHKSASYGRWLLVLAGWLWSAVAMGQSSLSCGTPVTIASANLLGAARQTTTLSGGGTYSGNYQVLGDLVLTNGTYTLTSGTTFYVDGRVTANQTPGVVRRVLGNAITVGANARLVLDGATLTASGTAATCPMWRGVVLNSSIGTAAQGISGNQPQLSVSNGSIISHALCAVDVPQYNQTGDTPPYSLTGSAFANNLTHVRDLGYRANSGYGQGIPSLIQNCSFTSDPTQMHYPYDKTSANAMYYTYQALQITPAGMQGADATQILNNRIDHALYGIVNNISDVSWVQIRDNHLSDIYQTSIWTVGNMSQPVAQATASVVSGNTVSLIDAYLNGAYVLQTEQIDPGTTMFGIINETDRSSSLYNSFERNYVRGSGNPQKPQVGMSLQHMTDASGNYLMNLTEGIRTNSFVGALVDNYISYCDFGIVVQDSGPNLYQAKIFCNSFIKIPGQLPVSHGIEVQPNAYLNDQGDANTPAANRYEGNDEAIHNDGQPFTYWYASSPQELPVATTTSGNSNTTLLQANTPLAGWKGYCSGQGAANGNGVNNRGTAPSPAYIAALADTVRQRLVPPARRRAYLYEVLSYYQDQNQLGALETWWATLLLPNAEDYRTTGLTLLHAYDRQTAPVAVQRVLAALQPQVLISAELAAELDYRLVQQHLPQTKPLLASVDSTALRALAWSGTPVAERAGQWLRYFYPRYPLPQLVVRLSQARRVSRPKSTPEAALALGAAYPNPAYTEVRITYQLPAGATAAELSFTNLLTSRVGLTVPVMAQDRPTTQTVSLRGLPSGQYVYRLLVAGQPVGAPQKLVLLP